MDSRQIPGGPIVASATSSQSPPTIPLPTSAPPPIAPPPSGLPPPPPLPPRGVLSSEAPTMPPPPLPPRPSVSHAAPPEKKISMPAKNGEVHEDDLVTVRSKLIKILKNPLI